MLDKGILTLAWASCAALLAMALPAPAANLAGRTQASFQWTPASGDVRAYAVYVARNGSPVPGTLETWTAPDQRRVTVDGRALESIVVTVAALDAGFRPGPLSPPSERVYFLPCSFAGFDSFPSDADRDGVIDACDNCPYRHNPEQRDTGGVGQGAGPDGIGDACQCGDVSGDGTITGLDPLWIFYSVFEPSAPLLVRSDLCDVGDTPGCSVVDGYILQGALQGTVPIVQQCGPARP